MWDKRMTAIRNLVLFLRLEHLENQKWNKTPSVRMGSHLPASSAGLKTTASNLHHQTKKQNKRHQNLKNHFLSVNS